LITTAPLSIQELADEVLTHRPRVVCITTFDTSAFFVERLCFEIRARNKEVTIFLGGAGATFNDERLHELIPSVDCAFRGEAEPLIACLMQKTIDKRPERFSIPGTTWKMGAELMRNELPALDRQAEDGVLDCYPSPYLSRMIPSAAASYVGTSTSRGCKGVCAYCQFPALFRYQFRTFSITRVTEELGFLSDALSDKRIGPIDIWDDDFATDRDRLVAMCSSLIAHRVRLPLRVELRGDKMDRELFQILREAGIVSVHFGLESANPTTLRRVSRVVAKHREGPGDLRPEIEYLESIKRAVELAKVFGIRTSVSIIVGLPGETMREAKNTVSFVKSLGVDGYQHNIFWALRGTPMWRWADQGKLGLGLVEPDMPHKLETTTYSYDVEAIPRLPNAIYRDRGANLPEALSGMINDGAKWSARPKFVFLKVESAHPSEAQNRWLSQQASYSTTVFLTGPTVSWRNVKSTMNNAYRQYGSVNVGFHGVRDHTDAAVKAVSGEQRISHIVNVPYAEVHRTSENVSDVSVVVQVLTDEDAIAAGRDSAGLLSGAVIPSLFLNTEVSVEDVCRWSTEALPCKGLARVYVESNEVRQCRAAKPLDSSGLVNLVRLRSTLESRYTRLVIERGCDSCAAKSRCAQCPDIGQISVEVYCTLMRDFPLLRTWFALLNNIHVIGRKLDRASRNINDLHWMIIGGSGEETYQPSTEMPVLKGVSTWGTVIWDPVTGQTALLTAHQIRVLHFREADEYLTIFRRQLTEASVAPGRIESLLDALTSVIRESTEAIDSAINLATTYPHDIQGSDLLH
jgi:radical SAM superfamily enzyme YgiQ (UPF0313 family)